MRALLFGLARRVRLHHTYTVAPALLLCLALTPRARLDGPSPLPVAPAVETQKDPASGIEFPTKLKIQSRVALPEFTFVGCGVRTVSFLGLQVYSVAFYADLSNPKLKVAADAPLEDKIEQLLEETACVLRIVPTRNTNYTHLRDGFVRTMQGRLKEQVENGQVSPLDKVAVSGPINNLKSIFPNSALKKGHILDVILTPPSHAGTSNKRVLLFRDIGRIESNWLAREFFLAYLQGEISPPLKKTVAAKLEATALPIL